MKKIIVFLIFIIYIFSIDSESLTTIEVFKLEENKDTCYYFYQSLNGKNDTIVYLTPKNRNKGYKKSYHNSKKYYNKRYGYSKKHFIDSDGDRICDKYKEHYKRRRFLRNKKLQFLLRHQPPPFMFPDFYRNVKEHELILKNHEKVKEILKEHLIGIEKELKLRQKFLKDILENDTDILENFIINFKLFHRPPPPPDWPDRDDKYPRRRHHRKKYGSPPNHRKKFIDNDNDGISDYYFIKY